MNRRLAVFEPRSTELGSGPASPYTIAAGVIVAILQVLNQLLLAGVNLSTARDIITAVLAAAAAYGIQPLFGPALTNLVHIPAQVLFFLAGAITAATGVLSMLSMGAVLHAVLVGALTLVGAVLFGSPILVPPTPGPPPVTVR